MYPIIFNVILHLSITFSNCSTVWLFLFRVMSKQMPECEEEMRNIPHITEANYLKYGQRLLDITQRHAANKLGGWEQQ